jgi:hypothetical protein
MTRRRYQVLVIAISIFGPICALAIILYGVLSTMPSRSLPIAAPTEITITLTADRLVVESAGLSEKCAGMTLAGYAVGGSFERPLLVTRSQGGCPASRFWADSSIGIAVVQADPVQ